MTTHIDAEVRDEAGALLGTVPMERGDWWRYGYHFRFHLRVELPRDLISPAHIRVEGAVLDATRWSPGGSLPSRWCLKASASEIPKLDCIPGFKPAARAASPERKTMKFRKKPVVIEAFQMTRERRQDNSDWPQWLHEAWNKGSDEPCGLGPSLERESDGTDPLIIRTLEGVHFVGWNDWIIRGVKGELYPCKPDIFAATYEPVVEHHAV